MSALIDQVAQYLDDNGIGTIGTSIFKSHKPSDIAANDIVIVYDTGGTRPDIYLPTENPTIQIYVRNGNYSDGRAVVDNIRALLHNQYNTTFGDETDYIYYCQLAGEPGHIGRDENNRDEFTMNFALLTYEQ